MPAVPKGIEMCVPLVGERKNEILQVPMIRSADDKVSPGPKQLLREARQVARSKKVLDYLRSDSHIKALVPSCRRLVIYSKLVKDQPGRRTLCEPDAVGARLATHHFVSSAGKLAT
jgi:hypothetical protein